MGPYTDSSHSPVINFSHQIIVFPLEFLAGCADRNTREAVLYLTHRATCQIFVLTTAELKFLEEVDALRNQLL